MHKYKVDFLQVGFAYIEASDRDEAVKKRWEITKDQIVWEEHLDVGKPVPIEELEDFST